MHELGRLTELIARHAGEGLTPTALPGVSVLRATAVTEPLGEVAEPTVAVIAQGVKETALNGRTFAYGPGQLTIVPVELPVVGHITQASPGEPFLAFVLRLRPEKIATLLAEATPVTTAPRAAGAAPRGIAVSDASPALLDAIGRLLALLGAPDDAAVLAAGVEREILWRLLTGPHGPTVRQVGLADSRLAYLARAIHRIRSHYDQTLRIEDLAALAAMSVTSFHRHFRALTSMTPIQFQKQIRLHEARTASSPNPGTSPAPDSRSATTAPPSSAASTAACSAHRPAATRSRFARPPRRCQPEYRRGRRPRPSAPLPWLACSTGMTLPVAGMSLPGTGYASEHGSSDSC